ncbi:MAG: alpha/beta hydrolase, partial [Ramlibacter sp.]|nr:alpha/beta hydrolase [Ramlibacter sp.]
GDISIADLADCLMDGLDDLNVDRFSIFGLHGGNKVGASMVARHGDRVERFVYAGQSHSIIVSKQKRDAVFAATPSIAAVVSAAEALADSPVMWSREFRELTDIWWQDAIVDSPAMAHRSRVVDRAVDSLQAFLWRPFFYRAAYAYDMEADLRRIRVPTLILELTTPKEDREVGRQGISLLEVIAGSELVTLESPDTLAVTLEDRAAELAAVIREFLAKPASALRANP